MLFLPDGDIAAGSLFVLAVFDVGDVRASAGVAKISGGKNFFCSRNLLEVEILAGKHFGIKGADRILAADRRICWTDHSVIVKI